MISAISLLRRDFPTALPARRRCQFLALLAGSLLAGQSMAEAVSADQLIEFSLEDLMSMDIEVTSLAKREQRSFDSPSAVSVVTADDIRRSGATSVPEALRMVPGVFVGRISASEWAVGIRGLSGRFSRFLQVLVDGRSVYDGVFNGVNWDELNLAMGDIDHIEIIRGPSATAWGSNAVNGVVNIVTRAPGSVRGQHLSVASGSQEPLRATWQGGWALNADTDVRMSGDFRQQNGFESLNRELEEGDSQAARVALATEHRFTDDTLLFNADIFSVEADALWPNATPTAVASSAGLAYVNAEEDKHGFSLQSRWQHRLDDNQRVNTRVSLDAITRDSNLYLWDSQNADVDVEWTSQWAAMDFTLGLNNRVNVSEVDGTAFSQIELDPQKRRNNINSAFIYNTWHVNSQWNLEAGLRYEKNSDADDGVQGSLRTLWMIDEQQRAWAAISKAAGTPSRINNDRSDINFVVIPASKLPVPVPALVKVVNDGEGAENVELIATELGYRWLLRDALSLEVTLFHHDYRSLLSLGQLDTQLLIDPVSQLPYLQTTASLETTGESKTNGAEVSLSWQLFDGWLMQYAGSYIDRDGEDRKGAAVSAVMPSFNMADDVPAHQHSLRLGGALTGDWALNLWLRYVDELALVDIDAYTVADIHLGWQYLPQLQLSLVLQNLGAGDHAEAAREAFYVDTFEVEPSAYVQVDWSF